MQKSIIKHLSFLEVSLKRLIVDVFTFFFYMFLTYFLFGVFCCGHLYLLPSDLLVFGQFDILSARVRAYSGARTSYRVQCKNFVSGTMTPTLRGDLHVDCSARLALQRGVAHHRGRRWPSEGTCSQ